MTFADVELVLDAHAVNGEGPGWDERRGRLYFVDMRAPALHAFEPLTGNRDWWDMPAWLGCFGLFEDGRLALALRTGLHLFDPENGSLRMLAAAPYDARRFCFNDGGCDRQGRLIIGPMHHLLGPTDANPAAGETAPLWRYDGTAGMTALPLPPVKNSNGLALSPDGRTLYHCDTAAKTIWACDYDPATGSTERQRVFVRVEEGGEDGGPDGATVDAEGFYICAVFGAGCLLRFDPHGRLERRIELPVRYPTKPALGADDRRTLYVTSAAYPVKDPSRHPHAGALLALEAPAPGVATPYMPLPEELRP